MELLAEISDLDIGIDSRQSGEVRYGVRKAARAVVMNQLNEIALLYVSNKKYHKLPGGGVEERENIPEALSREVLEEVGVKIRLGADVGVIIEHRHQFELLQISYCYMARVVDSQGKTSFTAEEEANGFQLKWVSLEEALFLLQKDKPVDEIGKFIQKRDYTFLMKAYQLLDS